MNRAHPVHDVRNSCIWKQIPPRRNRRIGGIFTAYFAGSNVFLKHSFCGVVYRCEGGEGHAKNTEDLYYGEIRPHNREINMDSKLGKAMGRAEECE